MGVAESTVNKVMQDGVDLMNSLDNKPPLEVLDKMLQKLDSKALDEIYKITDSKAPGNNDYKLQQAAIWAYGKDGELIDQQSKKMAGIMEGLESTFDYLVHQAYQKKIFFHGWKLFFHVYLCVFNKPWKLFFHGWKRFFHGWKLFFWKLLFHGWKMLFYDRLTSIATLELWG